MFDYMDDFMYYVDDGLKDYKVGEKVHFEGICRSEIYFNEETGYGVYTFRIENYVHITISGTFVFPLISGAYYNIDGTIGIYKGSRTVKVQKFEQTVPSNREGIVAYLQTLYGLQTKAELIYDEFKDKAIETLKDNPDEVARRVKGIGKKSAQKWSEDLKLMEKDQVTMVTLLDYGLTQKQALRLIKIYEDKILDLIQNNPYFLIDEVKGYGFLTCDKIALEMGILPDNKFRIQSGILYCLENATMQGDCFLDMKSLIIDVKNLLSFKLNLEQMKNIVEQQVTVFDFHKNKFTINLDNIEMTLENGDKEYTFFQLKDVLIFEAIHSLKDESEKIVVDDNRVYLKDYYFFEVNVAKDIKRLAIYRPKYKREDIEALVDALCKSKGYVLEERQREAVIEFNLYKEGFFVLTGSAGTGKTFTLKLIMEVAKLLKAKENETAINPDPFLLLATAPTGKAAKVATEALNYKCKTVHRALEASEYGFAKSRLNPLYQNFYICDETSMMDIELASHYLEAIPDNKKVIFVGDVKQLESVGAGNVLKDIIASGKIKTIELNVSKRQDDKSGIIYNANRIIAKEMIESTPKTGDFFVMETDSYSKVQSTGLACMQRLLDKGYEFNEIQVLIPQRTGSVGVNMLNLLIQKKFNPIAENEPKVFKSKVDINGYTYSMNIHKGDKVMHIRNNYGLVWRTKDEDLDFYTIDVNKMGISNGECGVVEEITKTESGLPRVIVKYDDGYIFYDEGVDELELCYATTIHKSQGSAWKAIILIISSAHSFILTNNLLYTGVTRARKFACVIGDKPGIERALTTVKEIHRKTYLKERLQKLIK